MRCCCCSCGHVTCFKGNKVGGNCLSPSYWYFLLEAILSVGARGGLLVMTYIGVVEGEDWTNWLSCTDVLLLFERWYNLLMASLCSHRHHVLPPTETPLVKFARSFSHACSVTHTERDRERVVIIGQRRK